MGFHEEASFGNCMITALQEKKILVLNDYFWWLFTDFPTVQTFQTNVYVLF